MDRSEIETASTALVETQFMQDISDCALVKENTFQASLYFSDLVCSFLALPQVLKLRSRTCQILLVLAPCACTLAWKQQVRRFFFANQSSPFATEYPLNH